MWVTKLLISPVKKRIFCPKTTKFGPKLALLVNLGQAMQAFSMPCCGSVGGCGAWTVSRKTPLYFMFNCQKYIFDCQKYIFDCHPPACDYQLRLILVGKSTVGKTSLIRSPDHIFQNPGFRRFVALSRQNNRKLLFYQPPPGLWQEKTLTLAEKPQLASTFSPGSSMSEGARGQDPWNHLFSIKWNSVNILSLVF